MYINDSPVKAFKLSDEFYHIGSLHGPAYLLDYGEGLALIDTSCPGNLDFLTDNMRSLGYEMSDVKYVIHTHGHSDHYGCTNEIVALTGAVTYGGEFDLDCFKGSEPYAHLGEKISFTPDVIIKDGDVIKIGDYEIKFIHTPGHSEGVISLFLTLHVDGVPYLAGMFGGAGIGSFIFGYMIKHMGYAPMFISWAVISLISIAILAGVAFKKVKA
jgi:metallo-beta-lactamase class B